MKNISRRKFISQIVITASIPSVSFSAVTPIPKSELTPLHNECHIIYKAWMKQENIDPIKYLKDTMSNYNIKKFSLSEATSLDFKSGNLFSVNGLLLGKSEAAFLAQVGKSAY